MLDFGYYNMDCMEGMKQFPDNYFDLAIVDPPYGDGGGVRGATENASGNASTDTGTIPRGGWHGKQTYHLGTPKRSKSTELVEHGRRSSEKNHSVGRSPETGIFRRTVSRLTEPDYLGGQLLPTSTDTVFSDMAEDKRPARLLDGDVRICVDIV